MPIHDWTRVNAGIFHHFHQGWMIALSDALNAGGLPDGYYALAEQVLGGPIPDVVTLQGPSPSHFAPNGAGLALASAPPRARFEQSAAMDPYVARASQVAIHHPLGDVVALIEIVSPGNKSSRNALQSFVAKVCALLGRGIHLLIVDLFPPSRRDPQGIHKAIWDDLVDEQFELPADKRLTVAAYRAGLEVVAYVEPVAVGDVLPGLPIFLSRDVYVPAPLEQTYAARWAVCPPPVQEMLE